MSRKKKLINNTLINSLATVIIAVLQFAMIPILVRNLGIVEFGLIGIVNIFSIVGFISFFDFGMTSSIQRYTAYYYSKGSTNKLNKLINTTLIGFVFVGLILSICIYTLSDIIVNNFLSVDTTDKEQLIFAISIFSVSYIYQFPLLVLQSILEGFLKFGIVKTTLVISEIIKFLITLYLVTNGYSFEHVIILYTIIPIIPVIIYYYWIYNYFEKYMYNVFSLAIIKEIWAFSRYQFIGKASSLVYNQSDRIIIASILGPSVITSFDVLNKFPAMINRFFGLAVSAIIPISSSINQKKESTIPKELFHRGFRFYFAFICPVICACYMYSDLLLVYWVGDEFSNLTWLLRLLLIWCLLTTFAFGGNILMGLNKGMKQLTAFRISQAVFKILSLIALVGIYKLAAVPLSFLISTLPIGYLLYTFYKYLNFNIKLLTKDVFGILFIAITVQFIGHFLFLIISINNLLELIIGLGFLSIVQWIFIYLFIFTPEDRLIFHLH